MHTSQISHHLARWNSFKWVLVSENRFRHSRRDTVGKCYGEIWSWAIGFHVYSSDAAVEGWQTDHTTVLTGKHDGGGNCGKKTENHPPFTHVFILKTERSSEIWLETHQQYSSTCLESPNLWDTRAAERLIILSLTLTHFMQVSGHNMDDVAPRVKHVRTAL